jgi:hypothetical protein
MSAFLYTPDAVKTIRHHARTMSAAMIAVVMGCDAGMIERICRMHCIEVREKDFAGPMPEKPAAGIVKKSLEIQIDEAMLKIVRAQARQRGVDTHSLIEALIERIAKDGMFSAVLDR